MTKKIVQENKLNRGLGALLVRAALGSAGVRIVGMFFGFLVGVQLARALGAEGYGVYGLAMSIVSIVAVPTEFGLPQLLTREVAAAQVNRNWGRLKGVISWASRTNLRVSITVAFLVSFWVFWVHGLTSMQGLSVLVGLLMVPVVGQSNLRGAALRGLQHVVKGQISEVLIRPAFFSIFLFAAPFVWGALNPALAMGVGGGAALVSFFSATFLLRKKIPHEIKDVEPTLDSKGWISSALPMAMTQGVHVLQGNASLLILGFFSTAVTVGTFRVATSVFMLVGLPVSLFNMVSGAIVSRIYAKNDREALQFFLACLVFGMTLGTVLIALPLVLFGDQILGHVFGQEFVSSTKPLNVLCLGMVFSAAMGGNVVCLNMCGYERRVTRAFLISFFFMTVTGVPLVIYFGSVGAAVANATSMILWNSILCWDAKVLLGMDTSLLVFIRNPKILRQKHRV
jgi:O-antigen/teichoic acid export membrane protein